MEDVEAVEVEMAESADMGGAGEGEATREGAGDGADGDWEKPVLRERRGCRALGFEDGCGCGGGGTGAGEGDGAWG